MKNKIIQYILIVIVLAAIAGGWFYYRGDAAQKINSSKVNSLTSGLVGHWTFDGADMTATTVLDRVGGNTGTLYGTDGVPTRAIGRIGQALDFSGGAVGDRGITLTSSIITGTTYSVSMWIKHNSAYTGTEQALFGQGVKGIKYNGSNNKILYREGGTYNYSNTAITQDAWHHITVAVNSGSVTFYVDGIQDGTPAGTVSSMTVSQLGIVNFDGAFGGLIDEIRYYSRALSQSEITELYQQGQTKINASQDGKLESGLVAYYTMDGADTVWATSTTGTVTDKSPIGTNTGTLINMSQSTSPAVGRIGQALNFDGSNKSITKTSATGLPQGNNPFSISLWINTPSPATYMYMTEWGVGNINQWNAFGLLGGKLRHGFYGNDLWGNAVLTANAWYHVVATYNGTTRIIYLNGTEDTSGNPASTPAVAGSNLQIGFASAGDRFIGKLDEVRIYNRALSQSEITELYQQGQTKINASQTNKLTSGLVGHFTMDGPDINWGTSAITNRGSGGGTGTLNGGLTPAIGKIGQALTFGPGKYISMSLSSLPTVNNAFTSSAWINLPNAAYPYSPIACWGTRTNNKTNWLAVGSGYANHAFYGNDLSGNTALSNNTWYHVVVTYNPNASGAIGDEKRKIYLNGNEDAAANPLSTPNVTGTNLYIGVDSAEDWPFTGKIDEVRIYNRALSQSEVTELYNMGR